LSVGAEFIGVNHLIAHLLAPGLDEKLVFPALGVLVSGGHTHIYRMDSAFQYALLGRTLDDAVGEAFDKTAKLLNLPYPGGYYIDALASMAQPDPKLFSLPYLDNQNLNFSFSGLKTAVARYIQKRPDLPLKEFAFEPHVPEIATNHPEIAEFCASFNYCVAMTLYKKVSRALQRSLQVQALILAGGVAANSMLRGMMSQLASEFSIRLILPRLELCTDNGSMVAYTGMCYAEKGYCHDLSVEAIPRGKTIPWDYCQRGS
jgi:N6-L-threonylcarbamoyladenine synthase